MCGLSSRAVGQLLCQYIAALCPDDAVNNLFTSSAQPEVPEQYNMSPTLLSLRDLCVYNVDACIASSVFDTTLFDSSRQMLAALLDSHNAVDTARYLFTIPLSLCRSNIEFTAFLFQWIVVFRKEDKVLIKSFQLLKGYDS